MPVPRPWSTIAGCSALWLCGCQSDALPASHTQRPESGAMAAIWAAPKLTLFMQNVYVGTNVDAVLSAPTDQLPAAVGQALMTFMTTDWPSRADALAARIVASGADAVALNELTILTVANLSPLLPDLHVEFLPILMDRLAAHGGDYIVGAQVAATDANLAFGPGLIRLQDFDAVLVRADLPFETIAERQYLTRAPVDLGPLGSFELIRGFAAVELMLGGAPVRVVSTHLEPFETSPLLQAGQAAELLTWMGRTAMRTIVAGDLNSDPTNPAPASPYHQFAAAGFRDTWLERTGNRRDPGFTCCHAADLANPASGLVKRIDHVLVRSPHPGRGVTTIELFGADQDDRLPVGLWPSDHAGLIATITFPGVAGGGANISW